MLPMPSGSFFPSFSFSHLHFRVDDPSDPSLPFHSRLARSISGGSKGSTKSAAFQTKTAAAGGLMGLFTTVVLSTLVAL